MRTTGVGVCNVVDVGNKPDTETGRQTVSTKDTTKISEKVEIPNIASGNLSDPKSWTMATTATVGFQKNAEVIFRSVGFLAGVVILTETTQKDIITTTGVNPSALSKAKNALLWKSGEIAGDSVVTVEIVADALEILIRECGSIENADKARKGESDEDKKDPTLADMVANLYKWADKNGISTEDVVVAVVHEAEARQNGGV
jgi:hypothetical protein